MKTNRYLLPLVAIAALFSIQVDAATCFLRQSTASQVVWLPTFVDSTDGSTAKTGLTIANTDIKLSKAGGTTQTNKNSGGATHVATGDYYATFDATDTSTVGLLKIKVAVATALPVWVDCQVVEEAVYDALFAASAPGYVANAPVSVAQFGGTNGTFASGRPEVNVSHYGGTAGTFSGGRPEVNMTVVAGSSIATLTGAYPSFGITDSGTAQAGTATTLQLRSAANFVADNRLNGNTCLITGGTGVGESLPVLSYVNSTDTATMNGTWPTTPDNTSTYACFGTAPGTSGGAPTVSQIATAVWQDTTSGDFTVGSSIGKSLYTTGATPGASGGLQIAGTNAATTYADFDVTANVSLAGGLNITQSSSNTAALVVTGNGTGNGATFTSGSGATGNGIQATAASTNGSGFGLTATGSGSTMTTTPANVVQVAAQTASAAGAVTFPGTIASATNITAATGITVATNNDKTGYTASTVSDKTGYTLSSPGNTAVATALMSAQGALTGTCSSGSTTTCVDAALTQANASQLQDHLICFSDSWCALLTTFNPATDTATTTKVAPTTRSALTYAIFPSTAQ